MRCILFSFTCWQWHDTFYECVCFFNDWSGFLQVWYLMYSPWRSRSAHFCVWCVSFIKLLSQVTWYEHDDAEIYSTSLDESAITGYFFDNYKNDVEPIANTKLDMLVSHMHLHQNHFLCSRSISKHPKMYIVTHNLCFLWYTSHQFGPL